MSEEAAASGSGATGDSTGALEALRRRDDLLALLYWLHADQLNEAPSAAELALFSGPGGSLEDDLEGLSAVGLVEVGESVGADAGRVRLTRMGLEEAKRRFEEDFSPVLEDGVAGNAHEVMMGVCGPNAKCVKEGLHGECVEPVLPPSGAAGS